MPPVVLDTLHALNDFVGREIDVTDWLVMTQDRIDRFAEATDDPQWIHVDSRTRAKRIALRHNDCARFLDAFHC